MSDAEAIVELVGDELRRISDRGELASRAELQEAVGLGAGDLERALDSLRDRGLASEVEPDGYRYGEGEPSPAPAREVEEPGVSLAQAERAAAVVEPPRRARARDESDEVLVQLPLAVAKALDAAALGGIVNAGIAEAEQDGVPFIFEVTP
jgi:hypothetical protein